MRVTLRSPVSRQFVSEATGDGGLAGAGQPGEKDHQAALPAWWPGPGEFTGDGWRGVPFRQGRAAVEQVVDALGGQGHPAVAGRNVIGTAPLPVPSVVGEFPGQQHVQAAAGHLVAVGEQVGGAVRLGHPGAQQGVDHVVTAAGQRHRDDGARWQPVAGREHRPDQHLRGEPVRAGRRHRDDDEGMPGDRPCGVGDLSQLRAVQRPVHDDAEHPAGGQCFAGFFGGEAQVSEGTVGTFADAPDRTADAEPAVTGGHRVDGVERGDRCPFGVGQHQHSLEWVGDIEAADRGCRHFEGDLHRPGGAVGEPGPARDRVHVRAGVETGQGRQRSGQEQFEVRQLPRSRSVGRSVPK